MPTECTCVENSHDPGCPIHAEPATVVTYGESTVCANPATQSGQWPNEPTLSCSEVVERLRNEAYTAENWIVKRKSSFSVTKAEAILHSWRERRVQELPILEKFEDEIALHGGFGLSIDQLENLRAALVTAIGKASYPRKSRADQEGREA